MQDADETAHRVALSRARLALSAQRYADAEQHAGAALGANPDSVEAMVAMARALRGLGRAREALPFARQAIFDSPGNMDPALVLTDVLIGVRRYDEARAVASGLLISWPNAWQSHYAWSQAVGAGRHADRAEATAAAERARALAPHEASTHNLVGVALMRQHKNRQASACFRAALEQDPHHANALNNLAMVSVRRRSLGRAGRRLSGALAASPHAPQLHRNLNALVTGIVWRLFVVLWLAGGVIGAERTAEASRTVRLVTWVALMALVVACWSWLARSLPRSYRSPALVFRRLRPLDRCLLLIVAAICLALLVEAAATGSLAARADSVVNDLVVAGLVWIGAVGIAAWHARRTGRTDDRAP